MSKELPNNTVESNDRFTFTLERVVENESTETVFPGTFEDYTVYDNDTNIVAGSGNTGAAGTICLKAGQYAQIDTARYTKWRIVETDTQNYMLKDIASNATEQTISMADRLAIVSMTDGENTIKYEVTYTGEKLAPRSALTQGKYTVYKITVDQQGHSIKELVPSGGYALSITEVSGEGSFIQLITITETGETVALQQECLPAYAMLYDDGSMVFQRGDAPEQGKTLVKSYTGFENTRYDNVVSESSAQEPQLVPWKEHFGDIKTVEFRDKVVPISMNGWFSIYYPVVPSSNSFSESATCLTEFYAENLDISRITDMSRMFTECTKLSVCNGIGEWDTRNVSNMNHMFAGCSSLYAIDVYNWNTSKVTDMSGMFSRCRNLTEFDLSNWDTRNVTNMTEMFFQCDYLETLNISGWDTSNVEVEYMSSICYLCDRLSEIHLGQKTTIGKALSAPSSNYIEGADGKWYTEDGAAYAPGDIPDNTEAVYYAVNPNAMYAILYDDGSFVFQKGNKPEEEKTLVASYTGFENTNYSLDSFVPWYHQRTTITTVSFKDKCSPTSTAYWFSQCYNLMQADVTNLDTSNVSDMGQMFDDCSCLEILDGVGSWDTNNVTDMGYMFRDCSSLTTLDVSDWDTNHVTDMKYMFRGCSSLKSLDVSGWDVSKVTNMEGMFGYCESLNSLNVSKWNTGKVTDMGEMFAHLYNIDHLDVSGFDTSNVTNMAYMFVGTRMIKSLDVSTWDTSKVSRTQGMFLNCAKLTVLDGINNWNTGKITNISRMFENCSELTTLDISNWDISNVTNMTNMFRNCPAPKPSWYTG